MEFIKTGINCLYVTWKLLGVDQAQLWIGKPDGPTNNNDERVLKERAEYCKKQLTQSNFPSFPPLRIEALDICIENHLGGGKWYPVYTKDWTPGIYRLNLHSHRYVEAPFGTPLKGIRDGEYSWPNWSDEDLLALPPDQQKFLYLERNNAGFCIRIEVEEGGNVLPAGDGLEWILKWPMLKIGVDAHYKHKLNLAKQA